MLLKAAVPPDAQGRFPAGAQTTPVMKENMIVTPNPNGGATQNFGFQAQAGTPPNDHATGRAAYAVSPYEGNGQMNTTYAGAGGRIGSGVAMQNLNFVSMSFQTFNSSGSPQLFDQFYNSVAGTINNATFRADSTGYEFATNTSNGEANLDILIDGTYLSNVVTGDLDAELVNGQVEQEVATGFFSGALFDYRLANGVATLDMTNLPALSFTFNIPDGGSLANQVEFDVSSDSFGAASVPEPPSLLMVGTRVIAGLLYGWHRRRRKRDTGWPQAVGGAAGRSPAWWSCPAVGSGMIRNLSEI